MILLDTNIVIDMLNDRFSGWEDFIAQNDLAICGITVSELYRGIKNQEEQTNIELFINSVNFLETEFEDFKDTGLLIAKLRDNGVSVPFQDSVIAQLCLKNKCRLYTKDRHFKQINAIIDDLNLV